MLVQEPASSPRSARRHGRVLFVPRPVIPLSERKHTKEACFEALKNSPAQRTSSQVDAIVAVLGQWRSFVSVLPKESQQRAIARGLEFQKHHSNSLLFKEGDITDGWYIVYSGRVGLFTSDPGAVAVPGRPSVEHLLASLFDRQFTPIRYVNAQEGFGSEDLEHDRIRTCAGVAIEASHVIRIDAHFYRMISKWVNESEIGDYSNFLQQIPELAALQVNPESYERLAHKLERRVLRRGCDADCVSGGWMVIEKGLVARQRIVDFSGVDIDMNRMVVGNVKIAIPTGRIQVRTDVFGPNHLIIDPTFSRGLRKPFTITVLEEATVLVFLCTELPNLLPHDVKREVEKIILDDPSDAELVKFWLERERKRQWSIYKARCSKEAREYVKQVSRETHGDFACRRPKLPKPIKGIERAKQRFKPVSKSLFAEPSEMAGYPLAAAPVRAPA
jgi:CRP-like cAMP-binding protein